MYRYSAGEENTTFAIANDQDSTKLQEEISKASEEISRIYGSLVWKASFFARYLI